MTAPAVSDEERRRREELEEQRDQRRLAVLRRKTRSQLFAELATVYQLLDAALPLAIERLCKSESTLLVQWGFWEAFNNLQAHVDGLRALKNMSEPFSDRAMLLQDMSDELEEAEEGKQ